MKCDSVGLLKNAAAAIEGASRGLAKPDREKLQLAYYAGSLKEFAGHVQDVIDGKATLEELAECYGIKPPARQVKSIPRKSLADAVAKVQQMDPASVSVELTAGDDGITLRTVEASLVEPAWGSGRFSATVWTGALKDRLSSLPEGDLDLSVQPGWLCCRQGAITFKIAMNPPAETPRG